MDTETLEQFLSDAMAGVPVDPWTAEQILESWHHGQQAIEAVKDALIVFADTKWAETYSYLWKEEVEA